MEEHNFPANSHVKKVGGEKEDPEKKIEQVTSGKVIQRKTPLGKRIKEMFVGGDAQSVGQYVLFEVLVPAVKDVIADMVSQGVERMMFGEARSTSRRTGNRPSGIGGYTAYNRYSSSKPPWSADRNDRRPEPTPMSRRAKASHDFDEIILATRTEAETVIDRLYYYLEKYEQVTVSDLYELVGVAGTFADEKWGWTELRGAGVRRIREGYLLDLPKPEILD